MADFPLLFQREMVLALLARRKRMTRRLVSRANSLVDGYPASKELWASLDFSKAWVDPGPSPSGNAGPYLKVPRPSEDTVHRVYPRRWVGDVAWVKETHAFTADARSRGCVVYAADNAARIMLCEQEGEGDACGIGKATGSALTPDRWRPSIFMPRWASRISLTLKAVRPERAKDISESDARSEGADRISCGAKKLSHPGCCGHRAGFERLWISINGLESWEDSPWCWVYSFTPVEIGKVA